MDGLNSLSFFLSKPCLPKTAGLDRCTGTVQHVLSEHSHLKLQGLSSSMLSLYCFSKTFTALN